MEIAVGRKEGSQLAWAAQEAMAGRYRPRVFAFVGMSLGLMIAPSLMAVLTVLTSLSGAGRAAWLGWLSTALPIALSVAGWQVGTDVALWRLQARLQQALANRGVPSEVPTQYSIGTDGLRISSERVSHLVAWPALLQITVSPTHWLLQADTLAFVLPRRAFPNPEAETAFIDAVLERMSPQAPRASLGPKPI